MNDSEETVFLREIPVDRITDAIVKEYEDKGCVIVYKDDSIEIRVKTTTT